MASIQKVVGTAFPALNRQGREADRSSSTSPEITNEWSYLYSPICLPGVHMGKPHLFNLP
jgi:hypothetical protein